jgi:uncharacterized coiled-coil protein SlyX
MIDNLDLELEVTKEAIKNASLLLSQHKSKVEKLEKHIKFLIEKRQYLKGVKNENAHN